MPFASPRSSFEETEALVNAATKAQHPVPRGLAPNQEPHLQVSEKSSQKELEAMGLGTPSEAIEIVSGVGGAPDHRTSYVLSPRRPGLHSNTHLVPAMGPTLTP